MITNDRAAGKMRAGKGRSPKKPDLWQKLRPITLEKGDLAGPDRGWNACQGLFDYLPTKWLL